jgi:hypothetical protein
MKTEVDGKTMLLAFVDVRKTVHQIKPALKAELCDKPQRLIATPHIELVEPQAVIHALEIVVVVLPPVVEVPV